MNIKAIRSDKQLSIQEFSSLVSIDEKRIKIIERGLSIPNQDEIQLLANNLNLPAIEIDSYYSAKISDKKLIGEGYVTAINQAPNIHYPISLLKENKLTVLDLFCGVGGLSYGFEQNGNFTTIAGVDLLEDRIKTFQKNHTNAIGFNFDINSMSPVEISKHLISKPDIIVGGAPCQGFSSIRPFRNLSEDDMRNNLFMNFASYVNYFKPEWFVFENVVGLLTHKRGATLNILTKEFSSLGYHVDFKVLNAAFYGVPQFRERLILVGSKSNQKFNWPVPSHYSEYKSMAGKNNENVLKPSSKDGYFAAINLMDALDDLAPLKSGEESNVYIKNDNLSNYQQYLREGDPKLNLHSATTHSTEMLNIIRNSGYNIEAVRHLVTSGFSSCYSRLEPNKPSVTLTVGFVNPSSNKCIHPYQDRALTPREGARIQGFPDSFEFSGSRTQIVKQIGNAVPPILSKVIADSIFKYY